MFIPNTFVIVALYALAAYFHHTYSNWKYLQFEAIDLLRRNKFKQLSRWPLVLFALTLIAAVALSCLDLWSTQFIYAE